VGPHAANDQGAVGTGLPRQGHPKSVVFFNPVTVAKMVQAHSIGAEGVGLGGLSPSLEESLVHPEDLLRLA
jgi:hypothetical protein